jgi:hypothetical protein
MALLAVPAGAHESENDGHIAANVNYGFNVIGRDLLGGITDDRYTDVWSHNGYAYVGTFQLPECDTGGVFIVDMAEAVANYPAETGATVAEINSPPDTRINDVKLIEIGELDVLITTEEPCGEDGAGKGGISLWDVTDPENPTSLFESFQDFGGVHNTYPWTSADGKTYLIGVANTFDFLDTFFVDISDPSNPELLGITGVLDWVDQGVNLDQLETGNFGFLLLHDVWVENIDGRDIAVLSYWDLGFVTLDVTDPTNPVFLGDSTYPETDPLGRPYEGNAHAAVFGANGDLIVGGDEDFDPAAFAVTFEGTEYMAGQATFGPPVLEAPLAGEVIWTGGEGCELSDVPAATGPGQLALIQRGTCAFSVKAANATTQGYVGYVVANDEARGDSILNMAPGDLADQVTIPGVFVGYSTGELMKEGGSVTRAGLLNFDGWGYLRVLNNTGAPIDVPDQVPGPEPMVSIPQLGEIGYYAPAETLEEELGGENFTEFGDLTMHNIEQDPTTIDVPPTFDGGPRFFVSWYSLGMRAVEYRPGHFHANLNGEGSYSWNVHEVGRFIAEDGSNFWGVHVDTLEIDGVEQQVILGSDRNTGLWIFTFGCEQEGTVEGPFYCDGGVDAPTYYMSSTSSGTVDGVSFNDEDIVAFDASTNTWSMAFDGSDVGLGSGDVDGFAIESIGEDETIIHLSFEKPRSVAGIGYVDDMDIVTFTGNGGDDTSGSFSLLADGRDIQLSGAGENIDALSLSGDDIAFSTTGNLGTSGLSAKDEDLTALTLTATGTNTAGSFAPLFDGSDVLFTYEDTSGASVTGDGEVCLSSSQNYNVNDGALLGDRDDVLLFSGTLGSDTSGTYTKVFDGDDHGFNEIIDGLHVELP